MPANPGQAKTRAEENEEARKKKVEAEKAQKLKDKPYGLWAPGVWEAAREAHRKGIYPKRLHPVILSDSGLFSTPQEVQTFVNLPSLLEVGWGSRATWSQEEEPKEPEEVDKMKFCEVDRTQFHRIEERTKGEEVLVWVQGRRRAGWLAFSRKGKGEQDQNIATGDEEKQGN